MLCFSVDAYHAPCPRIRSLPLASTISLPSVRQRGIMSPFHVRSHCNPSISFYCRLLPSRSPFLFPSRQSPACSRLPVAPAWIHQDQAARDPSLPAPEGKFYRKGWESNRMNGVGSQALFRGITSPSGPPVRMRSLAHELAYQNGGGIACPPAPGRIGILQNVCRQKDLFTDIRVQRQALPRPRLTRCSP